MTLLGNILLGVVLSATTGFRIFIPFLFLSIASKIGLIHLNEHLSWLGTTPVVVILLFATLFEVVAYFISGLDNVMDSIDTPIAVIAGILIIFSAVPVQNPAIHWVLAIVVGGVISGIIKSIKALIRGALTVFTGGIGNWILALLELLASVFLVIVAIFFI